MHNNGLEGKNGAIKFLATDFKQKLSPQKELFKNSKAFLGSPLKILLNQRRESRSAAPLESGNAHVTDFPENIIAFIHCISATLIMRRMWSAKYSRIPSYRELRKLEGIQRRQDQHSPNNRMHLCQPWLARALIPAGQTLGILRSLGATTPAQPPTQQPLLLRLVLRVLKFEIGRAVVSIWYAVDATFISGRKFESGTVVKCFGKVLSIW